jgi:hypothetical protein
VEAIVPDTHKLLEEIKGKVSAEQSAKLQSQLAASLVEKPRAQLDRIPLLLPILGAFGLVSTFYGFEKLLDQTDLVNHPIELIATGVVLLLLTGAFAKKL